MDYSPLRPPERNGAGDAAFALGVLAMVFAFVPIVGDFVALPSALGAVVLGTVGIGRAEQGLATNPNKAMVGVLLGVFRRSSRSSRSRRWGRSDDSAAGLNRLSTDPIGDPPAGTAYGSSSEYQRTRQCSPPTVR